MKSATAFRTISEVSSDLDVPQHVLRFWETKFPQIRPLKRGGGRRYYRPEDVELLRRIQSLLYKEGYTIKGVQRLLRVGRGGPAASDDDDGDDDDRMPRDAGPGVDDEVASSHESDPLPDEPPDRLPDDARRVIEEVVDELRALRDLLGWRMRKPGDGHS